MACRCGEGPDHSSAQGPRSARRARLPGRAARQPHPSLARRRAAHRPRRPARPGRNAGGGHSAVQEPFAGLLRLRQGRSENLHWVVVLHGDRLRLYPTARTSASVGAAGPKPMSRCRLHSSRTTTSPICGCSSRPKPSNRRAASPIFSTRRSVLPAISQYACASGSMTGRAAAGNRGRQPAA